MTRTLLAILFCLFISGSLLAQTPQGLNYQAVLRIGNSLQTNIVDLTFEINEKNTGLLVYKETHTNILPDSLSGVVNAVIGSESPIGTANFDQIDWANGPYEVLVSIRELGTGIVSTFGPTDLQSVAYSLYAETAGSVENVALSDLTDVIAGTPMADQVLTWNGSFWEPMPPSGGLTSGSGISINGGVISNTEPDQIVALSGSGATTISGTYPSFTISSSDLVDDADADPNNELQQLTLVGDTLSISGTTGNAIVLPSQATLSDQDDDTQIQVEQSPDEDKIRFILAGQEGMLLQMGTSAGAMLGLNPGGSNLFVGDSAGINTVSSGTTTGEQNTFIGQGTGKMNTTGAANTAIGMQALHFSNGNANTVIGHLAMYADSSGSANVAVGNTALFHNKSGFDNTAVGVDAMQQNRSGMFNVAVGKSALSSNTTGGFNTAIGVDALKNTSIANANTAIGHSALQNDSSGVANVAIGNAALNANISGNDNTAVGVDALKLNTIGSFNTAIGKHALENNIDGEVNTALGHQALQDNLGGDRNTGIGEDALTNNTSGFENTAVGEDAMELNISGTRNVAIGVHALSGNTNGFNNTALGTFALSTGTSYANATAVGYNAEPLSSNRVRIGNSSVTVIGGATTWSNLSDGRFKTAIQEDIPGLDFVLKLRPVSYTLDVGKIADFLREDYEYNEEGVLVYEQPDAFTLESRRQKSQIRHTGFIAQEVESAAQALDYDFSGVKVPAHEGDHYGISYSEFVVPLVQAIQEQQEMIQELKQELNQLKAELQSLTSQ